MKAGIYLGKENIEIQELELPEVGDRDVLVKTSIPAYAVRMLLYIIMAQIQDIK